MTHKVSNWGKYPVIEGRVRPYRQLPGEQERPWIPRGQGRCYGDASLAPDMRASHIRNRFLAFDRDSGRLCLESGVTYEDLLRVMVPQGYFPPVTPGTKFVSLGGALASDVHGKNHHSEGAISDHVSQFRLATPAGEIRQVARAGDAELFSATMGGLGLTGMILDLELQLKPIESSYIAATATKAPHLEAVMDLFETHAGDTYSVAWIDCLTGGKAAGRSILIRGEHARIDQLSRRQQQAPLQLPQKRKLAVPVDFPGFVLSPLTVRAFNTVYYHKQLKREKTFITDYDAFFYPLDSIYHWNRIYGKRGFVQYQFVIPRAAGREAMRDILQRIRQAGIGSFLAVLKLLGGGSGMMSFPMEGYTLALDFPVQWKLFPFLDTLDACIADYGGRVYLTKDARLKPDMLRRMYPELEAFQEIIRKVGNQGQIRSALAERLELL